MQVGIREMYQKDDVLMPGKVGIALSIEQWGLLCKAAPEVSKAVQDFNGRALLEDKPCPVATLLSCHVSLSGQHQIVKFSHLITSKPDMLGGQKCLETCILTTAAPWVI